MPNGFAVPLFYLLVGLVWFFARITTSRQRRAMLDWSMIAVFSFGAVGFAYSLLTGQL